MKKVLIICHHRINRSPGQRFRYEQYLSFLEEHGYEFHISNLLTEQDDKVFYLKGQYFRKGIIYIKTLLKRTGDWFRMNRYDLIFIFREALLTGSTFFEKRFAGSKARIIFDFDDAIWLDLMSDRNKKFAFLKNSAKTGDIIRLSDQVFAGNQYLADYAFPFNKNVAIIPTTIDTHLYIPPPEKKKDGRICIGWTGSFSTIQHFALAIPALQRIKEKYGDKVYFKIIGDSSYYCTELQTAGIPWNAATEVEDLAGIDIGIMPLPDDEWSRGKCACKGLQYMALEIPATMSPVGVNSEIVKHGVNGWLADTEDEWVAVLSRLIENKEERLATGKAGRQTVIEKYSVLALRNKYLEYFNQLTKKDKS